MLLLAGLLPLLMAVARGQESVELSVPAAYTRLERWWDVSPRPANDHMEVVKSDSKVAKSLPRPWTSSCKKTALLTSQISVVRLLGGWSEDQKSGDEDVAQGRGCEALTNESLLYERLDKVTEACLTPIVVLDNVPWCFSPNATKSFYGNGHAPADLASYASFLREVFEAILSRYGDAARTWYYRVGTEPNYGGHWNSGFGAYEGVYDAVVAAARAVLGPDASVGPGNMPNGMNGTFARLVAEHAAATDGQVMALSYYASGANGYSTESAHRAMNWLKGLRDAAFRNATSPVPALHAAEFGTLNPPHSSEASPEPGAFGAAFTASAWVVGLQLGYEKMYHWTAWDDVGDDTLLYGWTIGMALAELLFDAGEAHANATFVSSSLPMELADPQKSRNATSVAGVAAKTSAGRAVLLAAYDPLTYFGTRTLEASLVLESSRTDAVDYYCLSTKNAVYDRLYADLKAVDGLARTDGHAYKLKHMANDKGLAMVEANISTYTTLQDESLAKAAFPGRVAKVNDTHVVLDWTLPINSLTLVVVGE